jgi:hypothetical protein
MSILNEYGNLSQEMNRVIHTAGIAWFEHIRANVDLDGMSLPDARVLLNEAATGPQVEVASYILKRQMELRKAKRAK